MKKVFQQTTTTTTTTTTEASTETTTIDREKQMLKSAERSSLLNRKPTRKRVAGECNDLHGSSVCVDRHRLCDFWASMKECETNAVWMLVNCPRSCKMLSSTAEIPTKWNALLMQWGQFIAHDVSKTTMLNNQVCGTGEDNNVRQQYNENTAFIDGSMVPRHAFNQAKAEDLINCDQIDSPNYFKWKEDQLGI
ncbi:unnamed protein product [Meloidogyne enterolobii]|uniref:Uncharacterized protein n=1 Tax=Meloidogyne enterolobii TaxID=390850 RepID=A0ACB0ZK50_MELEN